MATNTKEFRVKNGLEISSGPIKINGSSGSSGQVLSSTGSGVQWVAPTTGSGTGDVVGPASSTINAVVRFDGTTGKLIKNSSGVTIDDSSNITTSGSLTVSGNATFDTNTLFVDATNDRVGVGTVSPSTKLEVVGGYSTFAGLRIGGTDTNVNQIWQSNSGTTLGITANGGAIVFGQTSTEQMRLTAGGSLGIGVTPRAKLETSGSIFATSRSIPTGGAGPEIWWSGTVSGISSYDRTNSAYKPLLLEAEYSYFTTANGSEQMRINNTGVGIGTASPSEKLSIKSATSNSVVDIASLTNPSQTSAGVRMLFNNGYGNLCAISSFQLDNGAGADNGVLAFQTASDTVLSTKMTILDTGNVGIGTSSPTAKITVSGTGTGSAIDFTNTTASTGRSYRWVSINSGGFAIEDMSASGAERMRITSSGSVGIGIASPAQKLDINGKLRFTPNTADTNYSADIYANYDSAHPFQLDVKNNGSTAEYLGVYADGGGSNNRVVFPTGNVGIGITSPSYKLDVNGSGNFNGVLNIAYGTGTSGADHGLSIYHGSNSGGYGRIRFYENNSNTSTIHNFSTTWQGGSSGTINTNSAGCINLDGPYGVTIGGWNGPTASFNRTTGLSTFNGAVSVLGAITQSGNQVLHAGNFSSYTLNRNGDNTTGIMYFTSNKGNGTYLGGQSNYSLQAYSSDGGAAAMSFHRAGLYAVNMGLDPDNVFRIGGWSASANRLQLDMGGTLTIAGSMNAYGGTITGDLTVTSLINGTVRPRTGFSNWINHNISTYTDAAVTSRDNTEDSWIFLDKASAQWGIYHRQIDSDLANAGQPTLPANSVGYVGGNNLTAYLCMADGRTFAKGGFITPDTTQVGIRNMSGTSWIYPDDIYGNMWIHNEPNAGGMYFDSDNYYIRYRGTTVVDINSGGMSVTGNNIGSEVYSRGWFRNDNSGTGLYNQATANHFYSDGQYWNVAYSGTTGIRFRNGHNGTISGYLYAETSGYFGLLTNQGNWSVLSRPNGGGIILYGTSVDVAQTLYVHEADNKTRVPRTFIQSSTPTGTITNGDVWLQY